MLEKLKTFLLFNKRNIIFIIFCVSVIITFCMFTILINKGKEVTFEHEEVVNLDVEEVNESETYLYVDIKGEVNKPGVYSMPSESRIIDVIEESGGLTSNANTRYINLSKSITNEMVIVIYSNDEIKDVIENNNEPLVPCVCENIKNDACIDNSIESEDNTKININTASFDELMTLSGIGESKANAIISYRENTLFEKIEDIMNVTGISEATFNNIKENITI